jgi:hypothetical protein
MSTLHDYKLETVRDAAGREDSASTVTKTRFAWAESSARGSSTQVQRKASKALNRGGFRYACVPQCSTMADAAHLP